MTTTTNPHGFAAIEARSMALLNDTQGKRINARLQAGMNYAMACELQMGNDIDRQEVFDGIINGVVAILLMTGENLTTNSKAFAKVVAGEILKAATHQADAYRASLIGNGVIEQNMQRGTG